MLFPYAPTAEPLTRLADGTVKQISPFTGTEVWTVPGRGNRPIAHAPTLVSPITAEDRSHACAFCSARYLETPGEVAHCAHGARRRTRRHQAGVREQRHGWHRRKRHRWCRR